MAAVTGFGATSTATATGATAAGDPTVISDWNALAVTTFGADPAKAPQETPLYVGFVQAAVYNAVDGIDRRYGGCPDRRGTSTAISWVDGQTVAGSAISWRSGLCGAATRV